MPASRKQRSPATRPEPAANHNGEADNETESNDGPADASAEPSIRRGAGGFPDTLSVSTWARDPDLAATEAAARTLRSVTE